MNWIATAAAIITLVSFEGSGVARAAITTLSVNGKLTSIEALKVSASDFTSSVISTPPSIVHVGDKYSLTAVFNISQAQIATLYDSNPNINIYNLPNAIVTLNIGSYSTKFSPPLNLNSTVQIWNNLAVSTSIVDAQSFEFFNYNSVLTASLPFSIGSGNQSEGIEFESFDFTGTARSNDLISSFAPFSLFGSKTFSYDQYNSNVGISVVAIGQVDEATIFTSTVPEPSSWALMVIGIGTIGLKRRSQKSLV